MQNRLVAIAIIVVLSAVTSRAETPLGTAFTYQGQLKNSGSPAGGSFIMVFQLFDALTLGNQIGPTLTFNGAGADPPPVTVTDGLFTVPLDFGSTAFGGNKRWLSIIVNGTPLAPRQELTAAPNALNADKLDGLNSTSFLQSIPLPLTLSGSSSSHVIRAENSSSAVNAVGVMGLTTAASSFTYGGWFQSASVSGRGLYGYATSPTGTTYGIWGQSASTSGRAILGQALANTGINYGVYGSVESPDGYAGYFLGGRNHFEGNVGIGTTVPESKLHVTGLSDTSPSGGGLLVLGETNGANVSFDTNEIMARDNGLVSDLFLNHNGGNVLVMGGGTGRMGIRTSTPSATLDVNGDALIRQDLEVTGHISAEGISAQALGVGRGATFDSGPGISFAIQAFTNESTDIAIRAYGPANPSPVGYAAQFVNDIDVIGEVSKDSGSFKIDHPLDPANKYLKHSFVESPDMMNVYNGNIVTDERGYATVELPDWFETLNRDFRYQLTTLDETDSNAFVQVKVVRKMEGNRFTIRTSSPACEVSWQITGIRQDAWANANRIQVEQEKVAGERGLYRHPELYGEPPEKGMTYDAAHAGANHNVPLTPTPPSTANSSVDTAIAAR